MEFPLEEVKTIFSIAESTMNIINRLRHQFKEPNDDGAGENEDVKDCIKEAISILTKETQAKKSSHLEKFVENTLFNPECQLTPSTIFSFLKDIEQMTWRQFCLLEGFRRRDRDDIEIFGYNDSGLNGISIKTDIKQLIDLNYLMGDNDSIDNYWRSRSFDSIYVLTLGKEISSLLDLQSVELSEIGKAFGKGNIKETVIH